MTRTPHRIGLHDARWTWVRRRLSPPLVGLLVALTSSASGQVGGGSRSLPVSPGLAERASESSSRCPTFSLVPTEHPVELAVYLLEGDGPETEPVLVLRQRLPLGASSWTPAREGCLEAGATYAWAVRELREGSEWSAPFRFRTPPETMPAHPGRPLKQDAVPPPLQETGSAVEDEHSASRAESAAASVRHPTAGAAPLRLRVEGAVQATTFAGDGSSLTGIEWSSLVDVPLGLADGVDDVIVYSAGNQLTLSGTTFEVLEGASSGLDADLLDGLEGLAYAKQAVTYTKDEVDALLVLDNLSGPIPAAPERLRLANEPRAPKLRRLAWSTPSLSGVSSFVVYQASFAITESNKTLARRSVTGSLHATVDLFAGSGPQHFRVEAVNVLGEGGPLSEELIVDTTPRVAYRADQRADELYELFVATPGSGSAPIRVSDDLITFGDVYTVKWSPLGSHLAYNADQDTDGVSELYVVSATGGGSTKLNDELAAGGYGLTSFAWSPDGTRIAFVADQETALVSELFVVPITGGGAQKISDPLTPFGDVSDFIAWSPDGTEIAYLADQETDGVLELFVAPASGGGSTKVNNALIADGDVAGDFSWSPDGSHLAYRADQDSDEVDELFVVPVTGGGATKLNAPLPSGGLITGFEWSPDGTRIAFIRRGSGLLEELWITPAAGGAAIRINDPLVSGGDVTRFAWSPAASHIAYGADQETDNVFEVYVAPATGGGSVKVSDPAGGRVTYGFAWSPDGARIAYLTRDQDFVFELWVTSAAGGGPTRVNDNLVTGGNVTRFWWSPDGARLAYLADQDTNGVFELFVAPAIGGGGDAVNSALVLGGDVAPIFNSSTAWSPLGNPARIDSQ